MKKAVIYIAILIICFTLGIYYGNKLIYNDIDFIEGEKLFNKKEYKRALPFLLKSAQRGNPISGLSLGLMYEYGEGVEKDYKKSVFWYKMSAKQKNAIAENNLGTMYYSGKGLLKNYKKAFYWFSKAAVHGNKLAQYNLGCMYYDGESVLKNHKKAFHWIKKSAVQGNEFAQNFLSKMYRDGKGVLKNPELSQYWLKKSSKINIKIIEREKQHDFNNELELGFNNEIYIRISPRQATRIKYVKPLYPEIARRARIHPQVVIEVLADVFGNIVQWRIISGHPLVNGAAINAVKQWKFEPFIIEGIPKATKFTITINFNHED
jgi:TonB family protein